MNYWQTVRSLFPALQGRTFLNSATFGQLSTRTVAAMTAHLERRNQSACADFLSWFDDHDRLRGKLARLIGSSPDDIAYLPHSNAGLALLMNGITWQPGDEVVTLEGEFPNNVYAPAFQARHGVRLLEVPWDGLRAALTPRTRLVALSAVNYTSGFRAPLAGLGDQLRGQGALLYVDATQMLGALRFDWAHLRPDMLTVNCYKWMLAPNGVAFMAVRPELRERLDPLNIGWRSHAGWRNVDNLHMGVPELAATAEKYEGGMLPSALLYGLEASVDLQFELDPEAIEQRVLSLANYAREQLSRLGAEPLPYTDTPIIAARLPGRDASAVARELKARNVLVSARQGLLRVSTHFYNDESDVAALCQALAELL